MKVIKTMLLFISIFAILPANAIDPESAIESGQGTREFCEDKLNQRLKAFLTGTTSSLLTDFYQLSQMKLTANVLPEGSPTKKTLEDHLSRKIQRLRGSTDQMNEMTAEVMSIYAQYGEVKTHQEARQVLSRMAEGDFSKEDKTYRGTDAAVAIRLLRHLNEGRCESQSSALNNAQCMTPEEEAVVWVVGEINARSEELTDQQKRNMDLSNLVAHYTGAALKDDHSRDQQALTFTDVNDRINQINDQISSEIDALRETFYNSYSQCEQFYGSGECFEKHVKNMIPKAVEEVAKFFIKDSEMASMGSLDSQGLLTLGGISLYAGVDPSFQEKVEAHQSQRRRELSEREGIIEDFIGSTLAWEENEVQMCGGNLFKSEMKNIRIYGLNGRVAEEFKKSQDYRRAYREGGRSEMVNRNNESSAKNKVGRILQKFHIPGPMFRCSNEPVRVVPTFTFKKADKLVCCDNEEKWETMFYGFANFGAGFSCRAFVGVPYIAELGVKVGAGVTLSLGGGSDPAGCRNQTCLQGSLSFNVSGGIYGDVLSGAASAQGTIAWVPFASVRQCGAFQDPRPPARINYKIGHVLFHGSIKVGWFASYEITKTLYTNDENNEHDIAIF